MKLSLEEESSISVFAEKINAAKTAEDKQKIIDIFKAKVYECAVIRQFTDLKLKTLAYEAIGFFGENLMKDVLAKNLEIQGNYPDW